jgi:hypothetical protein
MVVYGPPIQTLILMAESADLTLEPDDDSGCYMRDVEKGAVLASSQFSGVHRINRLACESFATEREPHSRSRSLCASINSMYLILKSQMLIIGVAASTHS